MNNPLIFITDSLQPLLEDKMKLDANGLNAAIGSHLLSDDDMFGLGFTDHKKDTWYLCVRVETDITLNISIPKDGSRFRIDVLDEDFGQPYDYQNILKRHPKLEFARSVKARVENQLELLTKSGVITGFTRGMYV
jgi:hypothetical protein